MDPEVREYLWTSTRGWAAVQYPLCNGDPIGADVVQLIDEVYEHTPFASRAGRRPAVDNIRTAHARKPSREPARSLSRCRRRAPGRLLANDRGDRPDDDDPMSLSPSLPSSFQLASHEVHSCAPVSSSA